MGLDVIAPQIYARLAEKYGYKYIDRDQELSENMRIYRSEIFAGNRREATKASYAIHYCENSWVKQSKLDKIKHYFQFFCFLLKSNLNK